MVLGLDQNPRFEPIFALHDLLLQLASANRPQAGARLDHQTPPGSSGQFTGGFLFISSTFPRISLTAGRLWGEGRFQQSYERSWKAFWSALERGYSGRGILAAEYRQRPALARSGKTR